MSVLTPTWNRGSFLARVSEGLRSQTFRDFEWIVCDDGSSDDTSQVLARLQLSTDIPMKVVSASTRIGKPRMDNEGIRRARGTFILWNDSDDVLLPNALDRLIATWNSIPSSEQIDYVGITALCGDSHRTTSTRLPFDGVFDTTWNELRAKFKVDGDMLHFIRADLLKQLPFPEVDFMVPEQIVWSTVGHMRTRVCPEVLKIVQYNAPNAISFSGTMSYCRGRAYALAITERNLRQHTRSRLARSWAAVTFLRCCIHGEIDWEKSLRLWGANSSLGELVAAVPAAVALSLKDVAQGRVRRTHREFEAALRVVHVNEQAGHS